MTPPDEYAMGMAQVLATLAVAVAVIARRTSTRRLQSAQRILHFVLAAFGLIVLMWDVMVASGNTLQFLLKWLRPVNLGATGALLLLVYALAPFFQTEAEKEIEAEAKQISRARKGAGAAASMSDSGKSDQRSPKTANSGGPSGGATQGPARTSKSKRKQSRR